MRILVRNLSRKTDEEELRTLFEKEGFVESCTLIMDEKSGKSKGFAFVKMGNKEVALKAIEHLNHTLLDGERIRVKITH